MELLPSFRSGQCRADQRDASGRGLGGPAARVRTVLATLTTLLLGHCENAGIGDNRTNTVQDLMTEPLASNYEGRSRRNFGTLLCTLPRQADHSTRNVLPAFPFLFASSAGPSEIDLQHEQQHLLPQTTLPRAGLQDRFCPFAHRQETGRNAPLSPIQLFSVMLSTPAPSSVPGATRSCCSSAQPNSFKYQAS